MEMLKEKISCMAIVLNRLNKVLILNNEGEWVFNKGHLEEGESLIECAIRETKEEAGIELDESECLGQVDEFRFYFDKENAVKVIKVFAFMVEENKTVTLNSGEGFIDYMWLDFDKAVKQLTHDDASQALQKAIERVKK